MATRELYRMPSSDKSNSLVPQAITDTVKNISVCVCTYKRPHLLKRLLNKLDGQETGGLFTYSIVVVDNDHLESAKTVVSEFATASTITVTYCVEPRRNIALARNKAIENISGDFVALIDDDEFPTKDWLLSLFTILEIYEVDGVLGPVKRHFDDQPPTWLVKSSFYERKVNPTGATVNWLEARTGNVLLKARVFDVGQPPFRPQFRAGEDQDFFRRMMEEGHRFVWSAEAPVYEVVPPIRWKITYMLRKALLRGATARLQPSCGPLNIGKSVVAVVAYTVALPFLLVLGYHRFVTLLVKLFDHIGKLLAVLGINPISDEYITE